MECVQWLYPGPETLGQVLEDMNGAGEHGRDGAELQVLRPERGADARVLPVGPVVVPQQLGRAHADQPVLPIGHVRRQRARRLGDVDRPEGADEPVLVLLGDLLTPHQQEVVLTEEPAQLRLVLFGLWTGDVKVDQLGPEHLGQRHNLHAEPPLPTGLACRDTRLANGRKITHALPRFARVTLHVTALPHDSGVESRYE